jgi:hypothetical protein
LECNGKAVRWRADRPGTNWSYLLGAIVAPGLKRLLELTLIVRNVFRKQFFIERIRDSKNIDLYARGFDFPRVVKNAHPGARNGYSCFSFY